jgi:hypothetical protein
VKRIFLAFVLALFSFAAGCSCTVEKQAVRQVENSHNIIAAKLISYVNADSKLSEKDKDDWKKLIASDKANIDALKRALGD